MAEVSLSVASGGGILVRRDDGICFLRHADHAVSARIGADFAAASDARHAVAGVCATLEEVEFEAPPIAVVVWPAERAEVLAFGDLEVQTNAASAPLLTARGMRGWIEHTLRNDDFVVISIGELESAIEATLPLGVIPAGGIELALDLSARRGVDLELLGHQMEAEGHQQRSPDEEGGNATSAAPESRSTGVDEFALVPESEDEEQAEARAPMLNATVHTEVASIDYQPPEPQTPAVLAAETPRSVSRTRATEPPDDGDSEVTLSSEGRDEVDPLESSPSGLLGYLEIVGHDPIPLDGPLTIGRSPRTDRGDVVRIDDKQASRNHLAVEVEGSSVHIEDLGSRNGTAFGYGGQVRMLEPEQPILVRHGMIVQIGETRMTFHLEMTE